MCNLYDLDVTPPFLRERFRLKRIDIEPPRTAPGLVRPSDLAPVVHLDEEGDPVCSLMEWGFVRQWKSPTGKQTLHRLFNARSETIDSKPTFAPAFRRSRAIIPVSGWYELPQKGTRVRLSKQDGALLAMAGLWERATHPKTGAPIVAFTMAMTESNEFSTLYHDRMPCLLEDHAFKAWLDPERYDAKKFLVPYPVDDLVAERQNAAFTSPADLDAGDEEPPVEGQLF